MTSNVSPQPSGPARDREPPPHWDLDGLRIAAVGADQARALLEETLPALRADPDFQLLLLMTPAEFKRGGFDASELGHQGVAFALEADVTPAAAEHWVNQFLARHKL